MLTAHGQIVQRSCRRFDGIGIDAHTFMVWNDDGAHSGTFTGASHRAEVAHVGHSVKNHDKGVLTVVKQLRHHVLDTVIGYSRHHGEHALVVAAGDAVDFLYGDPLHGNAQRTCAVRYGLCRIGVECLAQQNLVDVFAGFDGFEHCMNAVNVLGFVNHFVVSLWVMSDLAFSIAA